MHQPHLKLGVSPHISDLTVMLGLTRIRSVRQWCRDDALDPMQLTTHIFYKYIHISSSARVGDVGVKPGMGPPSPASKLSPLSEAALP